jgi:hypothetical protein
MRQDLGFVRVLERTLPQKYEIDLFERQATDLSAAEVD